ncbi:hypothetical protein F4679DRAFT_594134 [Xylaria curta]|nr:hypothetical protein F4679DRAFT_594134 [Xylaria curta]
MVENPTHRPAVGNVQRHHYIFNTEATYLTESLSKLVRAYQLWESRGGTRQSLFSTGGAQGYYNAGEAAGEDAETPNEEWDFGTEHDRNQFNLDDPDVLIVTEIHGLDISRTPQSFKPQPRRRRPPPSARELIAPLAKKEDLLPTPNLPLRSNDSEQPTVRESIIDLDAALDGDRPSRFVDLETIKAPTRSLSSDQVHIDKPRTQDWTFPLVAPASAGPDVQPSGNSNKQASRISTVNLIDLDEGLGPIRPATAPSNYTPTTSDVEETPFGLEADASGTAYLESSRREPSLYVSADFDTDSETLSFISKSEKEAPIYVSHISEPSPVPDMQPWYSDNTPPVHNDSPHGSRAHDGLEPEAGELLALALPPWKAPPSAHVMEGFGSHTEVKDELRRLILSFEEHLQATRSVLEKLPVCHSRTNAASEKEDRKPT